MSFVVFGILQAGNNNALLVVFLALGAGFMLWFFLHIRANERAGKEPLLSTGLFRNRTSNLGLRDPEHPVAAAHGDHVRRLGLPPDRSRLQRDQDRGRLHGGDRRHPGLVARRRAARAELRPEDPDPDGVPGHYRRGGAPARPGQGLLPRPGLHARPSAGRARPGGHADPVGQRRSVQLPRGEAGRDLRAFAQRLQPGSSLGTAIAGSILVTDLVSGNRSYVLAIITLAVLAIIGFAAAMALPANPRPRAPSP